MGMGVIRTCHFMFCSLNLDLAFLHSLTRTEASNFPRPWPLRSLLTSCVLRFAKSAGGGRSWD